MPDKQRLRVEWPMGGRSDRYAYQHQPPYTAIAARNVWPTGLHRDRGGSRPGLTQYFSPALTGPILGIATLNYIPNSTSTITSLVVVVDSAGRLFTSSGGQGGTLTQIGTLSTAADQVLTMAEHNQKVYIAAHSVTQSESETTKIPVAFDPIAGTIVPWVATEGGVIPKGCRCVCTWRDRLVLAGGTTEPYGVFLSRQGEPLDFDYSSRNAGAAVNLALASAGQIGEVVTALAPSSDNCLIIGCPTSLWNLQGDPADGGQLVNVSQTIGIVDCNAWCTTPDGQFVFMSADGLYVMGAGCSAENPQPVSRDKLPVELLNLNRHAVAAGKVVSLAYDVRWRGIHIFITDRTSANDTQRTSYSAGGWIANSTDASHLSSSTSSDTANSVHWFLDWQTKSLWEVQFGLGAHDPWCCHARKNYPSSESVVLMGCRDGTVRAYLSTSTIDGESAQSTAQAINSYVVMGPLTDDPDLADDVRVDQMDMTLALDSGRATWTLFAGNSPEEAVANITAVREAAVGRVQGGRNPVSYPRVAGAAIYLMLASTSQWAFESCSMLLSRLGRTRV